MNIIIYFLLLLIISCFYVFLLSESLYLLIPYIYLILFGKKVVGIIKKYHVKKYYIKERPYKLRILYYPEIEFFLDGKKICSIIYTVKKPYYRQYKINDRVNLRINKIKLDQAVIEGNCRIFSYVLRLLIGIYFVFLTLMIGKSIIYNYKIIFISNIIEMIIFFVIFFIRMFIFMKREILSIYVIRKYSFINLIIYIIIFILSFLNYKY